MMKLNKIIFFTILLITSPALAEYIIFQNNGKEILPITGKREFQEIYSILQTYKWPMIIASSNKIDKKEFDEISQPFSAAAEENFLRKKLKERSSEYDIAFIPDILYEIFTISLKDALDNLPYCRSVSYIKKEFSKCHLHKKVDQKVIDLTEFSENALQDFYDYFNELNRKEVFSSLARIINNSFLEFIPFYTKRSDIKNIQQEIDSNNLSMLKYIISQPKVGRWYQTYLFDDNALQKILDLEYEARNKNFALIYRGGTHGEIYMLGKAAKIEAFKKKKKKTGTAPSPLQIPIEGSFLAYMEMGGAKFPEILTYEQLKFAQEYEKPSYKFRDWNLPLNSISYGNTIYAGYFCDSAYNKVEDGACACDYLDEPSLIGYALFINKQKFLSGKLPFLLIPPLNTLTSFMGWGEFFHPRTKVINTNEYFLKTGNKFNVPGIGPENFIDDGHIFIAIGDPLEKAKELSEFIQVNARILKLPNSEGGFNFTPAAELKYREAQIDLTNMLKTMITIRKAIYKRHAKPGAKSEVE